MCCPTAIANIRLQLKQSKNKSAECKGVKATELETADVTNAQKSKKLNCSLLMWLDKYPCEAWNGTRRKENNANVHPGHSVTQIESQTGKPNRGDQNRCDKDTEPRAQQGP